MHHRTMFREKMQKLRSQELDVIRTWVPSSRNCWFPSIRTNASQSWKHKFPVLGTSGSQALEPMLTNLGTTGSEFEELMVPNIGPNPSQSWNHMFPVLGTGSSQMFQPMLPNLAASGSQFEPRLPKLGTVGSQFLEFPVPERWNECVEILQPQIPKSRIRLSPKIGQRMPVLKSWDYVLQLEKTSQSYLQEFWIPKGWKLEATFASFDTRFISKNCGWKGFNLGIRLNINFWNKPLFW